MYQAEGVSITAGNYGIASERGDPSERADRAMPETAARRGALTHVLVVDDEPENVACLREVLEGVGYEVSSARDGREALKCVAVRQPDLILVDCVMPEIAARLAGLAQDGQIVAGPETVRRLGDRYHLEPVGAVRLKNITEPIEAQRIFGPSSSY